MKTFKVFLLVGGALALIVSIWLGLLYRTYGTQTLFFLLQSPPEYILTYSKNMFAAPTPSPTTVDELLTTPTQSQTADGTILPTPEPLAIPSKYMITNMTHTFQKLNNCGPSSASMAASTLGVTFDQFFAADILKGSYYDKNVSPEELVDFLRSQNLETIYRVNGNASIVEQLVAQNIPVIVEQWLVKRGSGEFVGHYRVVRGYDQDKQIFTTNDSFNGANFVIPYSQFDEWWRPFNRGYLVVYKSDQEELVKRILGSDWDETQNHQTALHVAQAETQSIGDGYSYFNLGTNAILLDNSALAASAYDKALEEEFPEYFLWYQFGPLETYYQQEQYDRVLQMAEALLAEAGETEEARYYKGLVFAKTGKTEEARQEFEKALSANPRYHRAATALEAL